MYEFCLKIAGNDKCCSMHLDVAVCFDIKHTWMKRGKKLFQLFIVISGVYFTVLHLSRNKKSWVMIMHTCDITASMHNAFGWSLVNHWKFPCPPSNLTVLLFQSSLLFILKWMIDSQNLVVVVSVVWITANSYLEFWQHRPCSSSMKAGPLLSAAGTLLKTVCHCTCVSNSFGSGKLAMERAVGWIGWRIGVEIRAARLHIIIKAALKQWIISLLGVLWQRH